jgi:hypothetical protein
MENQGGKNMLSSKGFTEGRKGPCPENWASSPPTSWKHSLTSLNSFLCSCSMKTDRHFSTLQQKKKKKKKKREEKKKSRETKHIPL